MKANAPEKIYVHHSKYIKKLCASAAQGKGDIEYTRTDAFIEKAVKWLEEIENNTTIVDVNEFVEEFKEAMKL